MNLLINSLKISDPEYFHREYKNDLTQEESGNYYFDQCKRITFVGLPFLSLYKPFSFPLSLTLGALRSFSSIGHLFSEAQNGNLAGNANAALQTIIAIIPLCGTLFAHPLGMLITTVHDCALDSFSIGQNLYVGDFQGALAGSVNLLNNTLYIALLLHGGLEIAIASLAIQALIGISHSFSEYQKGNYLEASGHLLMGMIRSNQLIFQINLLQMRWKIERFINERSNEVKRSGFSHLQTRSCENPIPNPVSESSFKEKVVNFISNYSESSEKNIGWSELIYAIENNYDDEIIDFCLENYSNKFTTDPLYIVKEDGQVVYKNLLITCVRKNKPEALRFIINENPKINVNAKEFVVKTFNQFKIKQHLVNERSILNVAIEDSNNSLEFIEILTSYGANINEVENYKTHPLFDHDKGHYRSPLYSAVVKGDLNAVQLLLKLGAEPNFIGSELELKISKSILWWSINEKRLDIALVLLEKAAKDQDALLKAVEQNNFDAAELLKKYGISPFGSPLELAIKNGYNQIIDMFLA